MTKATEFSPGGPDGGCDMCRHAEKIIDGSDKVIPCIIICICQDSDHNCHILFDEHPQCDQFKER